MRGRVLRSGSALFILTDRGSLSVPNRSPSVGNRPVTLSDLIASFPSSETFPSWAFVSTFVSLKR